MGPPPLLFLYETRTILRLPFISLRKCQRLSTQKSLRRYASSVASDLQTPNPGIGQAPSNFFKQKADASITAQAGSGHRPTITAAEQRAFDRLFRDLPDKDVLGPGQILIENETDTNQENILAIFSSSINSHNAGQSRARADKETLRVTAGDISHYNKEEFLSDTAFLDRKTEDRLGQLFSLRRNTPSQDRTEKEVQLNNGKPGPYTFTRPTFLNEIRRAEIAEAARQYREVDSDANTAEMVNEDQATEIQTNAAEDFDSTVDKIVKHEMKSIATAFDCALGSRERAVDAAIWETCLKKIFPLVGLLDSKISIQLDGSGQQKLTASTTPSTSVADHGGSEDSSNSNAISLPQHIPPLSIVSRLYPAGLLLALRLYAQHSPTSPYALAIIPYLRSLGPTSYVLGGTPQIYNSLIKLKWDVYSDLKDINDLLNEMERGGVEADANTHRLLVSIGKDRWVDMNRQEAQEMPKGGRGKRWWERSEQMEWFQRVGVEWKRVIAGRLREQGLGEGVTE